MNIFKVFRGTLFVRILHLASFFCFKGVKEKLSFNVSSVVQSGTDMFCANNIYDQKSWDNVQVIMDCEGWSSCVQPLNKSGFSVDRSNSSNKTLFQHESLKKCQHQSSRRDYKLYFFKEDNFNKQSHIIVNSICKSNVFQNFFLKSIISSNIFFKFSPELIYFLFENTRAIFVRYKEIIQHISSNLNYTNPVKQMIKLSIQDENKRYFKHLQVPIDLYFQGIMKNGIVVHFKLLVIPPQYKSFDRDKFISVYMLEPFPLSGPGIVEIKYHDCSLFDSRFKIIILENTRPDWEIMDHQAKHISVELPNYKVNLNYQTSKSRIFLGIVAVNKAPVKEECFGFEVKYRQCYSESRAGWTTDGCFVGGETNESVLHCQCWHLSLFGGGGSISPKQIELQNDIMLFANIHDSVVSFLVGSMILLYLIVIVWTRHADRKDELQRFVVVLDDNFPGEEWPYLITVYTGVWIGASTDSNVSLRLYGSKGMSRVHNLMSNHQRQVLKSNCDDWFLIFTLKSLGTIEKIHVFTDFTNDSPDWYCNKIMVYDLEGQKDYKFIVERWVSLDEVDDYVDFYCTPTVMTRKLRRDQIALDNIMFGLRETHLLLSIFTRHPRSSVTRSQRLSVLMCLLLLNMLTNIMFYALEPTDNPQYSDAKRKLVIQIESTLLSSPIVFMIIFCFKKSRIVTSSRKNVPMTLTSTAAVPLESGLVVNQGNRAMTSASMKSLMRSSETNSHLDPSSNHEKEEKSLKYMEEESEEEEVEEEDEEEEEVEEEEETDEDKRKKKCCLSKCFYEIKQFITQTIVVKTVMPVKIAEENEESFQIRKQWMAFAWLLCVFTILVSAFLVIFYSLKMNHKLTVEWVLKTTELSAKNILIMSPMKIIIFSITLALLYGQLHYIASFDCNTVAAMKKKLVGNERFLAKVLAIRKHKWYRPLTNRATMALRLKARNWRRWRIVINTFVVFVLYLIITAEVKMCWNGPYIYAQKHYKDMLDPKTKGFQITTFKTYQEHLKHFVIPTLDTRVWYNDPPKSLADPSVWDKDAPTMKDYVTKVVGIPRLRQLRVKPEACIVPEVMLEKGYTEGCSAPLNVFTLDKREYSLQWTQVEKATSVFWKYENLHTSPYYLCNSDTGECYGNGGYILNLDFNSEKSKQIIDDMFEKEWFDMLTKVLIFEFVSYNVNTNFVCYAAIIVERLPGGSYDLAIESMSFKSTSSDFILQLTILLSFALYYLLRTILLFNRKGLEYLFSFTGLLDIFLNVLLFCTIISTTLMMIARVRYLNDWQIDDQTDLQIPSGLILHREIVWYETAVLAIIIPAQLLHNLRLGKRYKVCFKIFNSCFKCGLGLGLITIMYHIGFHLIDKIEETESWHCLFARFYSPMSYYATTKTPIDPTPLTVPFHVIINITAFLACITIICCYRETKLKCVYTDDFNILVFIMEKFKITNEKIKNHYFRLKNTMFSINKIRIRAGADGAGEQDSDNFVTNRPVSYMKHICKDFDDKLDIMLEKVIALEQNF